MKRLRRVLETQQHVGEHRQRPLPHNGIPQSTEYLRVKEIELIFKIHPHKQKQVLNNLHNLSLKIKLNCRSYFAFPTDAFNSSK